MYLRLTANWVDLHNESMRLFSTDPALLTWAGTKLNSHLFAPIHPYLRLGWLEGQLLPTVFQTKYIGLVNIAIVIDRDAPNLRSYA